jgi:hypothetical protein
MTPLAQMKRNELKEYFNENGLWFVDLHTPFDEVVPEKVTNVTKKFIYTENKKYSSDTVTRTEEEAWGRIVKMGRKKILNFDYLINICTDW